MEKNNFKSPKFSFFKAPVTNTRPWKNINLFDAYRAIVTGYLKEPTNQLRQITDKEENRNFKATHFAYCTFSGMFNQRKENELIKHSGLIAIDIDHLEDVGVIRKMLLKDPYFETQLLFTSPNGNGLKWVIKIDISEKYPHATMFTAIYNYIKSTYNIEIDKACKDVSRATFLCFDPKVYINPKYIVQ
jgi:hypothetical protein